MEKFLTEMQKENVITSLRAIAYEAYRANWRMGHGEDGLTKEQVQEYARLYIQSVRDKNPLPSMDEYKAEKVEYMSYEEFINDKNTYLNAEFLEGIIGKENFPFYVQYDPAVREAYTLENVKLYDVYVPKFSGVEAITKGKGVESVYGEVEAQVDVSVNDRKRFYDRANGRDYTGFEFSDYTFPSPNGGASLGHINIRLEMTDTGDCKAYVDIKPNNGNIGTTKEISLTDSEKQSLGNKFTQALIDKGYDIEEGMKDAKDAKEKHTKKHIILKNKKDDFER